MKLHRIAQNLSRIECRMGKGIQCARSQKYKRTAS
jgi:hypothetical protein